MVEATSLSSALPAGAPAAPLVGLPGLRVFEVFEFVDERWLLVATDAAVLPCRGCGQRAESKGRTTVHVRDLPVGAKATRLVWVKRIWRCGDCARSWREQLDEIGPRAVLTVRARAEAARQVGELGRPVAAVARGFGVSWDTVMRAVKLEAADRFANQASPSRPTCGRGTSPSGHAGGRPGVVGRRGDRVRDAEVVDHVHRRGVRPVPGEVGEGSPRRHELRLERDLEP